MQHAILRDIVDDGSDLRNRSTRNSFRRAVDRTIDGQTTDENETGEQRGVDGECVYVKVVYVWRERGCRSGGRWGGGGRER